MCLHIFANIFLDSITYRIKVPYDVRASSKYSVFLTFFFRNAIYILCGIYFLGKINLRNTCARACPEYLSRCLNQNDLYISTRAPFISPSTFRLFIQLLWKLSSFALRTLTYRTTCSNISTVHIQNATLSSNARRVSAIFRILKPNT